MIKIMPSTNPCPEDKLVDYAKQISDLNIDYIHCDVMDGEFVKNKCLPIELIEKIRNNVNILLDIHLMVDDNLKYVKECIKLKPSIITIHYESPKSVKEIYKLAKLIKSKDIMFGISIKPNTPILMLEQFLDILDLILVMSVEPGMSGQKFIEDSLDRLKETKEMVGSRDIIIEVDGGINEDNIQSVIDAGAKFLVMGSAFYNSKDKEKLLKKIN